MTREPGNLPSPAVFAIPDGASRSEKVGRTECRSARRMSGYRLWTVANHRRALPWTHPYRLLPGELSKELYPNLAIVLRPCTSASPVSPAKTAKPCRAPAAGCMTRWPRRKPVETVRPAFASSKPSVSPIAIVAAASRSADRDAGAMSTAISAKLRSMTFSPAPRATRPPRTAWCLGASGRRSSAKA
jgi:hypothetical protein